LLTCEGAPIVISDIDGAAVAGMAPPRLPARCGTSSDDWHRRSAARNIGVVSGTW